ncbi:MAG: tagaturonate epimerase family protein [Clostridia bacterium]|nr:tagaturonate epimerase family protein [Clostridia bacterium]
MEIKIYNTSVNACLGTTVSIGMAGNKHYIIASGRGELFAALEGETDENSKYCLLSHENAKVLRKYFPYCAPQTTDFHRGIIALGDRLGLATPYHAQIVTGFELTPFFALHSPKETALTGRTFRNAVDDATFGAFCAKFTRPWGAEGVNLYTIEDVEAAVEAGCGILTLECGGEFEDIDFAVEVYERFCQDSENHILFSVSMTGNRTITDPAVHDETARKLTERGVKLFSFTPCLFESFQVFGANEENANMFEKRLFEHVQIAAANNYRIGIESIGYKYSILPSISRAAGGHFLARMHGASWLCGACAIAKNDPKFFRELVRTAAEITKNKEDLELNIYSVPDEELAATLDIPEIREVLHFAFGTLLRRRDEKGVVMFRDRIYESLAMYENDYGNGLISTIGRHVASLDTATG